LAPVGGIVVSGAVHHNINNKNGIESTYWKDEQLKNVAEPVRIYQVNVFTPNSATVAEAGSSMPNHSNVWKGALLVVILLVSLFFVLQKSGWIERGADQKGDLHPSVAVLPFVNIGNDPNQEYFSDGITEEIINNLAQIPGLKVTSRTSSFQFRNHQTDIKHIGDILGVATILEGSVRKADNRIKVTAQLVSADDGFHLWSNTYERELDDIFDIQEELSRSIVEALELQITTPNISGHHQTTLSLDAYNLYLQGRYFWNKRNEMGMKKSVEFFEQALKLDPGYSMAYVGLADAYNMMAGWSYIDHTEGFQRAKEAALKALEIDDQLGPAYAALAYVQLGYDWDWNACRQNFHRAQQLSPNYAPAFHWYSEFCSAVGRTDEAVRAMEKALQLDPLSLIVNSELSWLYLFDAGKAELALEQSQKTLEMDPEFRPMHFYLYHMHYHLGNFDLSFEHFQKYTSWYQDRILLEETYRQSGWKGIGSLLLSAIDQGQGPNTISPVTIAEYNCYTGNYQKALDHIEQAYRDRDYYLIHVAAWPMFKPMHELPRFQAVIENMGLDLSKLGAHL
jgi:TolB-like protein/Tfp pilus assembly protein PilF